MLAYASDKTGERRSRPAWPPRKNDPGRFPIVISCDPVAITVKYPASGGIFLMDPSLCNKLYLFAE